MIKQAIPRNPSDPKEFGLSGVYTYGFKTIKYLKEKSILISGGEEALYLVGDYAEIFNIDLIGVEGVDSVSLMNMANEKRERVYLIYIDRSFL